MVVDCAHSTTMNAFMIKLKVQQWAFSKGNKGFNGLRHCFFFANLSATHAKDFCEFFLPKSIDCKELFFNFHI